MILLDTHIVIWLALEPDKLSKNAVATIHKARKGSVPLAISDISLWEISLAARKNRAPFSTGLGPFLQEVENRFHVLPISARTSDLAADLPSSFPKDPADRIIVGTALSNGIPLITADSAIRRTRVVETIW
ncbi:MAG TPA: type II toxin-antitoxin system VapC family toxin [Candidatus Acidoferrales bacterium]|nr:type II toxin-antitoxin system VapC family toxin [Candidatus Acidoferrales bacterium]